MLAALSLFIQLSALVTSAPPAKTWAVVIGVGELADPQISAVPHGPADAERLRDHLTTTGGLPGERVLLLTDGGVPFFDPASTVVHAAPTRRNARLAVKWLSARVVPGDVVIVTYSGQAATGPQGEPLLVLADAATDDLVGTALDASWLTSALATLPVPTLMVLDTSFAGRGAPAVAKATTSKHARLDPPAGVTVWLAADAAIAVENGPHGAFSGALATALRTAGSPEDLWPGVLAALPASAPRPTRLGRADLAALFGAHVARERPELVLQSPHLGRVSWADFDPTGRQLATTADDGTIKLWSTLSHRIVANLDAPGNEAVLTWSPTGEQLLADGALGLTMWSAAGRRLWSTTCDGDGCVAPEPARWSARAGRMRDVMGPLARFSPDGRMLVVPSRDVTTIYAIDGSVVATLPKGMTNDGPAAWDPSGRWLAVPAANGTDVLVFAQKGWRLSKTLRGKTVVTAVAFSGDGKVLAVPRYDPEGYPRGGDFAGQAVRLFDATRGFGERKIAEQPNASFNQRSVGSNPRETIDRISANLPIQMSPDGAFLVAPELEAATIVNLKTLALTNLGSTETEFAGGLVKIANDSKSLAIYLGDSTRVYDLEGRLVRTIAGEAIALAPDLSSLLSGSDNNWGDGLAFKDVTGKLPARKLEAEGRPIVALERTRVDGKGLRLVAKEPTPGCRERDCAAAAQVVWDLESGRPLEGKVAAGVAATYPALTTTIDGASVIVSAGGTVVTSLPLATFGPVPATTKLEAVALDAPPTVLAIYQRARYPSAICPLAPDKGYCTRRDDAPPIGASNVTLWSVASGTRIGVLRGHRSAITGVASDDLGKTVVTTSLDTTMRIWDVASARALATIALLPRDGSDARWVITTPDGLFDGSPAGQAEMQWRVGDALFRIEQYAGELYTPGLLARLMAGERPKAALVVEDLQPPPRVKIVSPTRGTSLASGVAKVVVKVEDAGGGVTPAWLYVNGRRVPTTRAKAAGGDTATRARPLVGDKGETFEVELVEGTNHLRATAFNKDGTVEAAGDEIEVTWSVPEAERPVLHVIAIGVDNYEDATLRLAFAGADARAIAQAFRPGLFARIATHLVLDKDATKVGIKAAIDAVAKQANPRDALVVYLAGHGSLVGTTFYYLPWEARVATDDDVVRTGLSQAELADALMQVPAMKQVVVLDACHSGAGALALGRMIGQRDAVGLARAQMRLAKASGVFLIAASTAAQKAGEIRALGHGILTYALLTGLGDGTKSPGARTTPEGQVTMNALLAWLDEEVPRLTALHQGGPQNPVQSSTGQDFPIALGMPPK